MVDLMDCVANLLSLDISWLSYYKILYLLDIYIYIYIHIFIYIYIYISFGISLLVLSILFFECNSFEDFFECS